MATRTLSSGSVLLPNVGMSQSGLMLAALIGGFVVWLMMNQRLSAYWSILIGGGSSATATPTTGGSTTIIPPLISGAPNSGLTFKWTNPFGPGGAFGPPATTTTPPAAPSTGS